jgi:hypothetical protein
MAGWTRLPISTADKPKATEMNELRGAILERAADAALACFDPNGTTTDIPAAIGDAKIDHVTGLQGCIYGAAGVNLLAAAFWANSDLDRLVGSTTPGAGEVNVFLDAIIHKLDGSAIDRWHPRANDAIWPADTEKENIRHPNNIRQILDALVRLRTVNVLDVSWTYPDAGLWGSGSDGNWATARAAAFTDLSPGHAAPVSFNPTVILGRAGEALQSDDPTNYLVGTHYQKSRQGTINTDCGWASCTEAKLRIVEKQTGSGGDAFSCKVYVGGTLVATVAMTGTDGTVHVVDVDPSLITLDGTTTVKFEYDDAVTTDPGASFTEPAPGPTYYLQGWTLEPEARFFLVRGDYEYVGDFVPGDFVPGDFAT